jgi:hypothetical protein
MNISQQHMEQMAALVMLAFTIGLLVGETLRDALYGPADNAQTQPNSSHSAAEPTYSQARRKWQLYSGLFILLKSKIALPPKRPRQLLNQVVAASAQLVQPSPDRT